MNVINLFYELIEEEYQTINLMEGVNRDDIFDVIQNKYITTIYYQGDETINAGYRDIEPCVYGISKAGNPVIRAFQIKGATDTPDNLPGWRMFRTDRIKSFRKTLTKFSEPRPLYNNDGDKDMIQIFLQCDFKTNKQDKNKEDNTNNTEKKSLFTKIKDWFKNK